MVYGGQDAFELSLACIGAVNQNSSAASKASDPASLDFLVKVMDYLEQRDSLLS